MQPRPRGLAARSSSSILRSAAPGPAKQELHNQLQAAGDHEAALELLRQLTNRKVLGAG